MNNKIEVRNYYIEFLRIVFTIMICLWHFNGIVYTISHGYVCVEFFFILSGMLLCKSYYRNNIGAFNYTKKKIKRIFPKIWLALIPGCIILYQTWLPTTFTLDNVLKGIYKILGEILSVSNYGIFNSRLNMTLWYISILLVVGALIYSFLSNYEKCFVKCIAPIIVISFYSALLSSGNGCLENGSLGIWLSTDFCRGLAGISFGVLLFYILSRNIEFFYNNFYCIKNIAIFVSLLLFMAYIFTSSCNDGYAIIAFAIMLFFSFIDEKSINIQDNHLSFWKKMLVFGGDLTLDIYIIHYLIVRVFVFIHERIQIPSYIIVFIYLFTVFIAAYVLNKCSKKYLFFKIKE